MTKAGWSAGNRSGARICRFGGAVQTGAKSAQLAN
jgi:hypothetical protein